MGGNEGEKGTRHSGDGNKPTMSFRCL